MNAALEPAFAVLPQDHEVMLQCFEFVSRVDDLFSGGKGGMEDATNSVDIEPLSLGQEIQPLDSPADNSVDATPVAAAAADPALSTSEAVLARVSVSWLPMGGFPHARFANCHALNATGVTSVSEGPRPCQGGKCPW